MQKSLLSLSAAAGIAILATAATATSSRAEVEYPWCAISSSSGLGVPICDFATLEQCQDFIRGLSGFCRPNPRAVTQAPTARRTAR
jgi:hypothetical protein